MPFAPTNFHRCPVPGDMQGQVGDTGYLFWILLSPHPCSCRLTASLSSIQQSFSFYFLFLMVRVVYCSLYDNYLLLWAQEYTPLFLVDDTMQPVCNFNSRGFCQTLKLVLPKIFVSEKACSKNKIWLGYMMSGTEDLGKKWLHETLWWLHILQALSFFITMLLQCLEGTNMDNDRRNKKFWTGCYSVCSWQEAKSEEIQDQRIWEMSAEWDFYHITRLNAASMGEQALQQITANYQSNPIWP